MYRLLFRTRPLAHGSRDAPTTSRSRVIRLLPALGVRPARRARSPARTRRSRSRRSGCAFDVAVRRRGRLRQGRARRPRARRSSASATSRSAPITARRRSPATDARACSGSIPDRAVDQPHGLQQPRGGAAAAPRLARCARRTRPPGASASTSARAACVDVEDAIADYVAQRRAARAARRLPRRQRQLAEHARACAACRSSTRSRPLLEAVRDAAGAHAAAREDRPRPRRRRGRAHRELVGRARPRRHHRDEHDDLARGPATDAGTSSTRVGRRRALGRAARRARARGAAPRARERCPPSSA